MEQRKVLVTGIGGNVGQGVARNIADIDQNIFIVGTDIEAFSAGNHLCHACYKVPYAYDENYLPTIQKIIRQEKIELVIPTTDYEVYYLSLHQDELDAEIAVSDASVTKQYLDKYLSYQLHHSLDIPFAQSWLPSNYSEKANADIIVKPREGRGSRGLSINPKNPKDFTDEYLIQPLLKGTEITTAAYATKEGKLFDFITMKRSLTNGTTTQAQEFPQYDVQLQEILTKMTSKGELKGCFNVQSIITTEGEVIPFEINCRISGTNSIRHQLGYQDTRYILDEYLYKKTLEKTIRKKGIATRILMDVIYFENEIDNLNKNSNFVVY